MEIVIGIQVLSYRRGKARAKKGEVNGNFSALHESRSRRVAQSAACFDRPPSINYAMGCYSITNFYLSSRRISVHNKTGSNSFVYQHKSGFCLVPLPKLVEKN